MAHMTIITDNDGSSVRHEKEVDMIKKEIIIKSNESNLSEKYEKSEINNQIEKKDKKENQTIIEKARYMELYINTTFTVFLDCLYKNSEKSDLVKVCEYVVRRSYF